MTIPVAGLSFGSNVERHALFSLADPGFSSGAILLIFGRVGSHGRAQVQAEGGME